MRVKNIVIVVGLALWFSFCVMVIQGCAVSIVDGNRRMDFEVFMPYVTEEVTAEIEEDQVNHDVQSWIK